MENVSGMVKGKMKLAFADATRKLKASGYRVSCKLLDAKWFGVPQSRKRLIWIGIRDDIEIGPSHPGAASRPFSLADAIWDLLPGVAGQASPFERSDWTAACKNDLHSFEWRSAEEPSPTATSCRPPVVKIEARGGRYMKGRTWDAAAPLGAALPTGAPRLLVGDFYAANPGRDGRPIKGSEPAPLLTTSAPRVARSPEEANPRYSKVLAPKLPHHRGKDWAEEGRNLSKPSWAIPASAAPWLQTNDLCKRKENNAEQTSKFKAASFARPMTPRECARVQSFPDKFLLSEKKAQAHREVGNAVPPLMAAAIAQHLIALLADTHTNKSSTGEGV